MGMNWRSYNNQMQAIESENKSVQWKGVDVLLLFILYAGTILWGICIGYIVSFSSALSHLSWEGQLITAGKNEPMTLLVGFIFIVVTAPLIEEFVFRLLLQGWLASKFQQCRIRFASAIAIVLTSFVFAMAHVPILIVGVVDYFYVAATNVILGPLLFAFGIVYLARKRNVKMTHCLFGTTRFFRPRLLINMGYCLLLALLLFILCSILNNVLSCCVNLQFIRLLNVFFISLIFGILYSRTQKLSYCILLHAFYNGIVSSYHFLDTDV